MELSKEINYPRKGLTNIQNIADNECFKWGIVRCLYPVDHNPKTLTKADKNFDQVLMLKT